MSNEQKQILINNVKEWMIINKKINELQTHMKELKLKKKKLSEMVIKIMENNNIDMFDVTGGRLVHKVTKVKGTINKDFLNNMLLTYFEDNPNVDTEDVSKFILENRPIKENSSLVIKETK